jgi:hypothetical protein
MAARRAIRSILLSLVILSVPSAIAQTTQPSIPAAAPTATTRPAAAPAPAATRPTNQSAEDMLRQMLQPQGQAAQPLRPLPDLPPAVDSTSGPGAVTPYATTQRVVREGTMLLDRIGRLTPSADGKSFELRLESDGAALADPPLVLLPNRKLMQLEDTVKNSYADQRVRVSGEISEYRGRNYLLLQRWNVVPDSIKPLQ